MSDPSAILAFRGGGQPQMLELLRVRAFAIIDELEVHFAPGFNVLTGETGAGKSILVDALHLVLGGRAQADSVRTGAEEAEVQALFRPRDPAACDARLLSLGLPAAGAELVVRRTCQRRGEAAPGSTVPWPPPRSSRRQPAACSTSAASTSTWAFSMRRSTSTCSTRTRSSRGCGANSPRRTRRWRRRRRGAPSSTPTSRSARNGLTGSLPARRAGKDRAPGRRGRAAGAGAARARRGGEASRLRRGGGSRARRVASGAGGEAAGGHGRHRSVALSAGAGGARRRGRAGRRLPRAVALRGPRRRRSAAAGGARRAPRGAPAPRPQARRHARRGAGAAHEMQAELASLENHDEELLRREAEVERLAALAQALAQQLSEKRRSAAGAFSKAVAHELSALGMDKSELSVRFNPVGEGAIRRTGTARAGDGGDPALAQSRRGAKAARPHRLRRRALAGVARGQAGARGVGPGGRLSLRRGGRGHRRRHRGRGRARARGGGAAQAGDLHHPPAAHRGLRRQAPDGREGGAQGTHPQPGRCRWTEPTGCASWRGCSPARPPRWRWSMPASCSPPRRRRTRARRKAG